MVETLPSSSPPGFHLVTCVRSAVRSGVKGVVVAAELQGGAVVQFGLINEGGGPNRIPSWAAWSVTQRRGGDCGTGITAAGVATRKAPARFNVPAAQFTVVGGG